MRFKGRVAIVTGAASGIGRATADRLADEGATVVAVDIAKDDLGDGAIVGDVSDPSFAPLLIAQTIEEHGRLDVLANVAGILRTANTHEHSIEVWDQVLAVNLTGTFLCCRAAIPELLKTRGSIVNVSSTAALAGHPWAAAYSASKGGVLALTPGSITTPITKDFEFPEGADMDLVRRIMALDKARGPETVAAAIAFLASDDAAHVNGEDVRVDGGTLS